MSCNRHYGIMGYPDCSGHGQCVNGFCVCDAGWTGIGDFELLEGYDCDISITGIKILAILYIILSFPTLLWELRVVSYIIVSKRLKIISVLKLKSKQACHAVAFIATVSGYIFAGFKLYDPQKYLLGHSLYLSINHAVVIATAFAIASSYGLLVMAFLEAYCKALGKVQRKLIEAYKYKWGIVIKLLPVWILLHLVVIQCVSIYAISPKSSDTINLILSILTLINYLVSFAFMNGLCQMLIKELQNYINGIDSSMLKSASSLMQNNSHKNDVFELLTLTKKMHGLGTGFMISGCVLYLVIVCWEFIRRKASYLILFQFIMMNLDLLMFLQGLHSAGSEISLNRKIKPEQDSKLSSLNWRKHWNKLDVSSVNSTAKGHSGIRTDLHRVGIPNDRIEVPITPKNRDIRRESGLFKVEEEEIETSDFS